ncbi:bifunctional phosphatase PAP2/diacylglycerol kinase family protein [Streptomyces sp. CB03911]|uniref:bifunctional phosphatase PAP2/diacylglycerol kinase family protein n=1 Tax=Streptomyces sp. CB03911 TaxID=1804758 RepID=UPI00093B8DE8|nr:bifunctional phosphatase PAP2/diacylglycerol kinase family protein [Streptomyces sp. CB03911]OKI17429.1 phosphoesterase [Streptomyces sp. CB03911]
MATLDTMDRALFDRVARARLTGLHPWLPRLSRAADHGVLWQASAGALAALGGRTGRRAALRGIGSLALASVVANVAAKHLTRRPRPVLEHVPLARQLVRQPFTTSFPSGHSASAAAFAVGVALESPLLGAMVAPVAGAVALSRVYVGAHYPGDVLAGVALGAGAAALTLRWWPRHVAATVPAAPPRVAVPALPGGTGLCVVVNTGSGGGNGNGDGPDPTAAELSSLLPGADVRLFGPEDDLAKLLESAADDAAGRGGALGVCGGDGTVNLAASVAAARGLPLAVFPGGTLNHFAVDLGINSLRATAEAVEGGHACAVDLGLAADDDRQRVFVNTFSLGVYPELVRLREKLEGRIGKWPALAVSVLRVLATAEPVEVEVSGVPRRLWLLFAGNGSYDPPGFAPTRRAGLADGMLDVRTVDGSSPFARTRLAGAFLSGTMGRSRVYRAARLSALEVTSLGSARRISVDGESVPAHGHLHLAKARAGLTVYRPAEPDPA